MHGFEDLRTVASAVSQNCVGAGGMVIQEIGKVVNTAVQSHPAVIRGGVFSEFLTRDDAILFRYLRFRYLRRGRWRIRV